MDNEKTIVVFRKWKSGDVIALFPGIESDGYHCSSYEHVGQHGGADYTGVIQATKPAKPEEYADLEKELTSIGYNLVVRKRGSAHLFYRKKKTVDLNLDRKLKKILFE